MQELAGRLTSLDPDASASFKVISYFDLLVADGASTEALVRAAVILSGVPAGAETTRSVIRVDADGRRTELSKEYKDHWPISRMNGRICWIEREDPAHANDAMILERLSVSIAIIEAQRAPSVPSAVEIVLDSYRPEEERTAAAARLRLGATLHQVVAVSANHPGSFSGPSAVVPSQRGPIRAVITSAKTKLAKGPLGVAMADKAENIAQAWSDAQLALRLTSDRKPIISAEDLGPLLYLARAYEKDHFDHPDISQVSDLDENTRLILDALVGADSVRSAAMELGLHHSTLQARHENLTRLLGYDPRSYLGKLRYGSARLLSRLRDT